MLELDFVSRSYSGAEMISVYGLPEGFLYFLKSKESLCSWGVIASALTMPIG